MLRSGPVIVRTRWPVAPLTINSDVVEGPVAMATQKSVPVPQTTGASVTSIGFRNPQFSIPVEMLTPCMNTYGSVALPAGARFSTVPSTAIGEYETPAVMAEGELAALHSRWPVAGEIAVSCMAWEVVTSSTSTAPLDSVGPPTTSSGESDHPEVLADATTDEMAVAAPSQVPASVASAKVTPSPLRSGRLFQCAACRGLHATPAGAATDDLSLAQSPTERAISVLLRRGGRRPGRATFTCNRDSEGARKNFTD